MVGYRSEIITSKSSHLACNARPVPTVVPTADDNLCVPRTGTPAHDCPRSRPAHTRRRRLGRRHVRDLCLPATGARHARAAATAAVDAGHLPEILFMGLDSSPAAACQRLLDVFHDLRWLCRCRAARPPDADDRLADDRAVRLAVPQTGASVQTGC